MITQKDFKNLHLLKINEEKAIAFHSLNLDVANISESAWRISDKALPDLTSWSNEPISQTAPSTKSTKVTAITLNVTQVCNLHCVYCAAGGDGSYGDPVKKISIEKTLPQIKFFIDKLDPRDQFRITFLGGEPLLYPEAIEMISDYAKKLALEKNIALNFVVVTNGTLINNKTISILEKIKPDITISLDGGEEINDQLRPNKAGLGVTKTVVDGIKKLLENKNAFHRIGVSGVFGKRNSDLKSAYQFYSSLNVDWFDFTFDHLELDQGISQHYTQELSEIAKLAFAKGQEAGLRKIKFFDTLFQQLDSKERVENYCGAGKSFLMIDARQNIYTCPWDVGNKHEIVGTGTDVWSSELNKYSDPLIDKPSCHNCWARYICGGGCMYIHKNKTGFKNKVDENFCNRTKDLISVGLSYYVKSRSTAQSNQEKAV